MNKTQQQTDNAFFYFILALWAAAMLCLFSAFCGYVERNGLHPSLFGIHDEPASLIAEKENL
jgi:hypothetical protein